MLSGVNISLKTRFIVVGLSKSALYLNKISKVPVVLLGYVYKCNVIYRKSSKTISIEMYNFLSINTNLN